MNVSRDAHTPGRPADQRLASWYVPGRADGFGDRLVMFDNTPTPPLELLRFRRELADTPGFEEQLRERVRLLQDFHHPSFVPIRSVQHLDADEGLTLVSIHTPGQRLSEIFERTSRAGIDPGIVAWMLREVTPALARLQAHGDTVAHGVLTPDRIILTPEGRLCIVEHVLGGAVRSLQLDAETLWRDFGVVVPMTAPGAAARLDAQTDVAQLAGMALSMLLGRPLTPRDVGDRLPALLDEAGAQAAATDARGLLPLRAWLERALQLDPDAYRSASDAAADLDDLRPHHASRVLAGPPSARLLPAGPPEPPEPAIVDPAPSARAALRPVPRQEPRNMRQYPNVPDIGDSFPSEASIETSQKSPETLPARPLSADDEVKALRARLGATPEPAPAPAPHGQEKPAAPPAAPGREARPAPPPAPMPLLKDIRPAPQPVAPEAEPVGWRPAGVPGTNGVAGVLARLRRPVSLQVAAVLGAIVIAEAGVIVYLISRGGAQPAASSVRIESPQAGDTVLLNGNPVGATPLELTLGADTQSLTVVPASPSFEGAAASARPAPRTTTPEAPETAAAAIPEAAAPRRGGLRLVAPVELTVLQGDRVLGSTADGPIYLNAGTHQVQLVNNALGYRGTQSITIRAGQTGTQRIDVPDGRVNLNAQPWARVFIDGNAVGETPLANVPVPLGDHEIVFRHPQLGERRERITVRADSVSRVTADFN